MTKPETKTQPVKSIIIVSIRLAIAIILLNKLLMNLDSLWPLRATGASRGRRIGWKFAHFLPTPKLAKEKNRIGKLIFSLSSLFYSKAKIRNLTFQSGFLLARNGQLRLADVCLFILLHLALTSRQVLRRTVRLRHTQGILSRVLCLHKLLSFRREKSAAGKGGFVRNWVFDGFSGGAIMAALT